MKTIGLCMIVKNEAPVILRCLESVRPLIDYVLIQDTGSTDGTQEIVRTYVQQHALPGEVYDQPWSDFATNRSSVLARLRRQADIDYALIMDADDVLTYAPDFDICKFKESLCADLCNVWIHLGPVTYHRPQICSNHLPFRFRGVLHEFLEGPQEHTSDEATGITIACDRDGSRSQTPDKYQRDAEILERVLETETDALLISRYTFYLAQSYRDHGEAARALPHYLKRAEQGFWVEERYIALYEAAKLKVLLGHPIPEVIGTFLEAYEVRPTRAESLHSAMHFCRSRGQFHQGYLIGKLAVSMCRPTAGLFLEHWIYSYGLFDEFSVLAYWSGHYEDSLEYANRILSERKIPDEQRERIVANVRFAKKKMAEE